MLELTQDHLRSLLKRLYPFGTVSRQVLDYISVKSVALVLLIAFSQVVNTLKHSFIIFFHKLYGALFRRCCRFDCLSRSAVRATASHCLAPESSWNRTASRAGSFGLTWSGPITGQQITELTNQRRELQSCLFLSTAGGPARVKETIPSVDQEEEGNEDNRRSKIYLYEGVFLLPLVELLLMDLGITISTLFRFNKIITIRTNSKQDMYESLHFFTLFIICLNGSRHDNSCPFHGATSSNTAADSSEDKDDLH